MKWRSLLFRRSIAISQPKNKKTRMSQIENFGTFSFFIIPYCNILSFLQLRHATLVGTELTHLSPPYRHAESLLYAFFVRFLLAWNFCKLSGKAKTQVIDTATRRARVTDRYTTIRSNTSQATTAIHTHSTTLCSCYIRHSF